MKRKHLQKGINYKIIIKNQPKKKDTKQKVIIKYTDNKSYRSNINKNEWAQKNKRRFGKKMEKSKIQ